LDSLISTAQWIENITPGVFVPPHLYTEPPGGWREWMARISGQPVTRADTISGTIVEGSGPAFAQWVALRAALTGETCPAPLGDVIPTDRRDEAQGVRRSFEEGHPLPIAPSTSVERFVSFVPMLRYDTGREEYVLGGTQGGTGNSRHAFHASGHAGALAAAARWYDRMREREIEEQKKQAREQAKRLPPIYVDLAVLQLAHDGLILNDQGGVLVLLNGAHGFYLVQSRQWCYADSMAPSTAVKLALLGAAADKTRPLLRPEELPAFAGLSGWQEDGAGGFRWEDGWAQAAGSGRWRVTLGGQARAVAVLQDNQVQILGSKRKLLAKSPLPGKFLESGPGPVLAWAAWQATRAARRSRRSNA
jgi:hypothetical protein